MKLKKTLLNLAADKRGLQKHSCNLKHSWDEVNKTIQTFHKKKR